MEGSDARPLLLHRSAVRIFRGDLRLSTYLAGLGFGSVLGLSLGKFESGFPLFRKKLLTFLAIGFGLSVCFLSLDSVGQSRYLSVSFLEILSFGVSSF